MLEPLLEVADSSMTYRRRYFAEAQLPPVLDLVLADATNPRALAFQLAPWPRCVAQLPRDPRAPSPTREERTDRARDRGACAADFDASVSRAPTRRSIGLTACSISSTRTCAACPTRSPFTTSAMQNSASAEVTVTYEVVHTTRYTYSEAVSVSHHVARVKPREFAGQECLRHELQDRPVPAVVRSHQDYFGNAVTFFIVEGAHKKLTVRDEHGQGRRPPAGRVLRTRRRGRGARLDALPLDAIDCLFDSASIAVNDTVAGYAHPSFPPGRPLLEAVADLIRRIHADFTFDPKATTVATPLRDVVTMRRGVCQDFARLGIACLRSQGLAARYVSGYLETVPPPGAPRLAGVDASHAWLAVYCPGLGWVDVDPTNNMFPSTTHVTLAWGRDYVDVSSVPRGFLAGRAAFASGQRRRTAGLG